MTKTPDIRSMFFRHPANISPLIWRWPNFSPEELECNDGSGLLLDFAAMDRLQALRNYLAAPLHVHSAYRSFPYNLAVGGEPGSFHLQARAFDISSPQISLGAIAIAAQAVGFTGIGRYATFVHVDDGPRRNWAG